MPRWQEGRMKMHEGERDTQRRHQTMGPGYI
jgi:hypothetical protein